jgi:hypothetical protein
MDISISSRTSGFRKWADIHEPTKIDKADSRATADSVDTASDELLVGTLDQQPHQPWLVPGTGKL